MNERCNNCHPKEPIPSPARTSLPDINGDPSENLQPPTTWIEWVRPHWSNQRYDWQTDYIRKEEFPKIIPPNQVPNHQPAFPREICPYHYPIHCQQLVLDQNWVNSHWLINSTSRPWWINCFLVRALHHMLH